MIRLFNRHRVRYLVIGGQAVRLEGLPRFSMDWDFFLPARDKGNIEKINELLGDEIDVPLIPLGLKGQNAVQTYQTKWGILQFHLGGPGLPDFDKAEKRAVVHKVEGSVSVKCLSGLDLLESKRKVNRPQDQQDIEFLQKKKEAGLLK